MKTSQGRMEAKQEKTEIVSQHCKWVSHIKAMHLLPALEGQASSVLHQVPKGMMYKETIRVLEDQFWKQNLVAAYQTQLETRTQIIYEPLQEFATTIEQLTHHAFPTLYEDHVLKGAGRAFVDGIRE